MKGRGRNHCNLAIYIVVIWQLNSAINFNWCADLFPPPMKQKHFVWIKLSRERETERERERAVQLQVITNTTWLSLRHLCRQSRAVSLDHTGEWWCTDRKLQSALSQGNLEEFRHRQLKICRAKCYECKVEHLEERFSSSWWKEVKKLTGVSKPGTEDRKLRCGPRQGSG